MEKLKLFKDVKESDMKPGFQFKESNRSYKIYTVVGCVEDKDYDVNVYLVRYIDECKIERYEIRRFYKENEYSDDSPMQGCKICLEKIDDAHYKK